MPMVHTDRKMSIVQVSKYPDIWYLALKTPYTRTWMTAGIVSVIFPCVLRTVEQQLWVRYATTVIYPISFEKHDTR